MEHLRLRGWSTELQHYPRRTCVQYPQTIAVYASKNTSLFQPLDTQLSTPYLWIAWHLVVLTPEEDRMLIIDHRLAGNRKWRSLSWGEGHSWRMSFEIPILPSACFIASLHWKQNDARRTNLVWESHIYSQPPFTRNSLLRLKYPDKRDIRMCGKGPRNRWNVKVTFSLITENVTLSLIIYFIIIN